MKPVLVFQNYYTPARDALFREVVAQGQDLLVLYAHLPTDEGRRWTEPLALPYKSVQMPHVRIGKNVLFWVPLSFWRWDGPVLATDNNPTNAAMIIWCLLFRLLKRRVGLWVEHIPDGYKGKAKALYQKTCTRILCKLSNQVMAFSAMTQTYLQGLTSSGKVMRMIQATPLEGPPAPLRAVGRLTRFGYLGSNVERKNVAALREAFGMLSAAELTLDMGGFDGPVDNATDPRVHYHGYVDGSAREAFFGGIDVLVLPSLADPWGFVANEALARGALAIVTNRCGSAEMVERITPTFVCDVTADSIAQAMAAGAALAPEKVRELRMRARSAIADYTIDVAAARFIENCCAVI